MKKVPAAVPYESFLDEQLKDPELAAAYLNAAIEENDRELVLVAIGNIVRAHGVAATAKVLRTHRETVYRMVSKRGNPTLDNFLKLLDASGLVMQVKRKDAIAA